MDCLWHTAFCWFNMRAVLTTCNSGRISDRSSFSGKCDHMQKRWFIYKYIYIYKTSLIYIYKRDGLCIYIYIYTCTLLGSFLTSSIHAKTYTGLYALKNIGIMQLSLCSLTGYWTLSFANLHITLNSTAG